MYKSILIIALAISTTLCHSATITATPAGGDWNDTGSWVGGAIPVSGVDDVVIPAGSTVDIIGTVNFNGVIDVFGNLNIGTPPSFGPFTPGVDGFLVMDDTSSLNVNTGSIVYINTIAGGSSTLTIGTNTYTNYFLFLAEIITYIAGGGTLPLSVSEAGVVTPIVLLYFKAQTTTNHVELVWSTASEENFDYFVLERSIDGDSFIEISQIHGMGDSFKRVDYSFEDKFPLIGRSYYRLRSVDFDGYSEIFDYVMVIVEDAKADFMIYPNPISNEQFSLKTNFESENPLELIIYNSMGSIERSYQINSWMNNLDLGNLKSGSYLVKLISKQDVIIKRVLVN